jgi:hypothetical protein
MQDDSGRARKMGRGNARGRSRRRILFLSTRPGDTKNHPPGMTTIAPQISRRDGKGRGCAQCTRGKRTRMTRISRIDMKKKPQRITVRRSKCGVRLRTTNLARRTKISVNFVLSVAFLKNSFCTVFYSKIREIRVLLSSGSAKIRQKRPEFGRKWQDLAENGRTVQPGTGTNSPVCG